MGGRTVATMCRQCHTGCARGLRGVVRLRSPMVLATHESERARGKREEQRAWASRLAAGGHMLRMRKCRYFAGIGKRQASEWGSSEGDEYQVRQGYTGWFVGSHRRRFCCRRLEAASFLRTSSCMVPFVLSRACATSGRGEA